MGFVASTESVLSKVLANTHPGFIVSLKILQSHSNLNNVHAARWLDLGTLVVYVGVGVYVLDPSRASLTFGQSLQCMQCYLTETPCHGML